MNLAIPRFLFAVCLTLGLCAAQVPVQGHAADADDAQIRSLLDTYTRSVSSGDERSFEALLLNRDIAFYGLNEGNASAGAAAPAAVQRYDSFRAAIFGSGARFQQRFYDVKIVRNGDLAQVELHFDTIRVASGQGGTGWKVLHLLKVGDSWKIAS